jgi:transposase
MIVLGADMHKRSHTIAAVSATTGELLGERTVQAGAKGSAALLGWARGLGAQRVWALEDCRHVSGWLERFLIGRGERVLRVRSRLMSASRREARGRGKSDSIDALSVARAALREGLDALPAAQLQGAELDLRLLVDHRERLVCQRVALNNTLQWHLHDIWPELRLPGSSLFYGNWGPRVARRLERAEQTMCVRIARDELRRIRELSQTLKALETEIAQLVAQIAPQLLSEPGLGPLTPAKLVGEIAGAGRFATDAKLARAAGVAPIPSAPAPPTATGSTAAATARSTRPSIASPSPVPAATLRPRTTSPANAPKLPAAKAGGRGGYPSEVLGTRLARECDRD